MPGEAKFPQYVVDSGYQGTKRASVPLVELVEGLIRNGEEGGAVDHEEVESASATGPESDEAPHNFSCVNGAGLMAESIGESANDWETQGLSVRMVVRVTREGTGFCSEGGTVGRREAPVAEHAHVLV